VNTHPDHPLRQSRRDIRGRGRRGARRGAQRGVRRGVTLIELLVTLAILGLVAGVTGLSLGAAPVPAVPLDARRAHIADARDSALRTGHPVTVIIADDGMISYATALPDGRVLADLNQPGDASP